MNFWYCNTINTSIDKKNILDYSLIRCISNIDVYLRSSLWFVILIPLLKSICRRFCVKPKKKHALALLNKDHLNQHHPTALKTHRRLESPEVRLQDCTISPSYSDSHI